MKTTRTSRLLDRLAVVILTVLYFAATGIDSVRRTWSSRTHVNTGKEAAR